MLGGGVTLLETSFGWVLWVKDHPNDNWHLGDPCILLEKADMIL